MSARDEAIEAAIEGPLRFWPTRTAAKEEAARMFDAAHASGAIVYADELEQVGIGRPAGPHSAIQVGETLWWLHPLRLADAAESDQWQPVFRKRPQEPNE